jgi:hypothetical protein
MAMATYQLTLEITDAQLIEIEHLRSCGEDLSLFDLVCAVRDFGDVMKMEVVDDGQPEGASA